MDGDLLTELRWRGLIQDVSDEDGLREALASGPLTLYAGYDPTASSLHVGNLQNVLLQRRFQLAGHRVIGLAGGGTGLIGDPSGRADERTLNTPETVAAWTAVIHGQLERLLAGGDGISDPILADNVEWIGSMSAIELLRDVGKHFPVGYMLAKESVSARVNDPARGMSFTEFAYMLLQAYDYTVLFERHDCRLQIGGSDQWGNITAGLELLRRTGRRGAFGLVAPLILRADGQKFGKSQAGAVWLDRARTAPFALYQYFLNLRDDDASMMLRRLSLRPPEEIMELEAATASAPAERRAQRALAEELTGLVHGEEGLREALAVTDWLFRGAALDDGVDPGAVTAGTPAVTVDPADWPGWERVLVDAGLASSGSDARRTIAAGGAYVSDRRIAPDETAPDPADFARGGIAVVRKGKRSRALLRLAGDGDS